MISTRHKPFSLVKRLNDSADDHIMSGYQGPDDDAMFLILKEPADPETYNGILEKRLSDSQTQYGHEQFKEWCMPEQLAGYIKASRHGLL